MSVEDLSQGDEKAPANTEVPFSFDEIFFSRTNEKGHILFGNHVFQRISQFSWAELFRKPHNIIRHPDMPRAVFWLLWETIQKGEPVGAYVKNRAKDGRYYWVFATVTPIEGGYLSVRLKPGPAFLPVVEREYAAIAAQEKSERLKPAIGAQILLGRLASLGFQDYNAFMAAALSQEMKSREQHLARPRDPATANFEALAKAAAALLEHADLIHADYAAHRYAPLNLRVKAAQVGEAAATIGVISMNYGGISNTINAMIADFVASAKQLSQAVDSSLFLICTAKLQKEMCEVFRAELLEGDYEQTKEIGFLEEQRKSYEERAAGGLRSVAAQTRRFYQSCADMKNALAALETTRIMGKMESARFGSATAGLNDLLGDLESYQRSMTQGLQKVNQINACIERDAERLLHYSVR